jgi:glutathione peroxidase-family protein
VNRRGEVTARFAPMTTPNAIEKHIVKLLKN